MPPGPAESYRRRFAVVAVGDEFDAPNAYSCQRTPGLLLAQRGVSLARTIAFPEIGIARSPVGHESHDGIGHSLQQCAVSHTLIVGMRQHQQTFARARERACPSIIRCRYRKEVFELSTSPG